MKTQIKSYTCGNGHTHIVVGEENFELSGLQPLWPQLKRIGFAATGADVTSPVTKRLATPVEFRGEKYLMEHDYHGNPSGVFTS